MKKIVFVVVAVMLCAALAMGCAGPTAAPSESAQATESASAEASVEASDAPAANGDYSSWTNEEWEAAADSDKTAATEALLAEIGDYMMEGYSDLMEQAKTNDSVKEQLDAQIESLKGQIENFLKNSPGSTIGDLAKASKQVVDGSGSAE